MLFPALEHYLARLQETTLPKATSSEQSDDAELMSRNPANRVWLDSDGRVQGTYFNTTLTSVFQPIRQIAVSREDVNSPTSTDSIDISEAHKDTHKIVGYEGFAHSYSPNDNGLYLWKLLDHAASDDESIELDRLCRMLHSINFYRQSKEGSEAEQSPQNADLYLSVHARLLAAVDSNHGMAFRRILRLLGLPHENIVLQLPTITSTQSWLLNYVLDNYRRNQFRLAVNADTVAQAHGLLERVRPDVLKIDGRGLINDAETQRLLEITQKRGIRVIFKRLEKLRDFESVQKLAEQSFVLTGARIAGQGFFWDRPQASLGVFSASVRVNQSAMASPSQQAPL
ncbi:EAL domain-containing protein [Glaciimonas sp. PAMC28666]|uniref:EAL domain-containing protein n=1 Tax=Glaciimonas sp. PAMC28666 TaxID=2807626 RepID=UPI00196240FC|nr:EAL domain-containing protein [Glaciimonas sp. PAMC28666]QRX81880.1 EAL domain-containing protein [Glaciimonas sp. PAMC28666]